MARPLDLQSLIDAVVLASQQVTGTGDIDEPDPARGFLTVAASAQKLQLATYELVWLLDQLPRQHVGTFREDDWVLEHPLACRRPDLALSGCPFNQHMLDYSLVPGLGRYLVDLVDGVLVVGEPVPLNGHAQHLAATLVPSDTTEEVSGGGEASNEDGPANDGGEDDGDRGEASGDHRRPTGEAGV